MLKKSLLTVVVLALVAMQSAFIYALQHGAAEQFLHAWKAFGVSVPEYTHFVFRTAKWWWAAPFSCIALLTIAVVVESRAVAVVTCVFSLVAVIALYWSAYSPALLIRL